MKTHPFITHPEARRAVFNERRAMRAIPVKYRGANGYPDFADGYRSALDDLGMVISIKLEYRDKTIQELRDALTEAHQHIGALAEQLEQALAISAPAVSGQSHRASLHNYHIKPCFTGLLNL